MIAATSADYSDILSQFIQHQTTIFGADVVRIKVQNVPGIEIEKDGHVKKITGDPQKVLESVTNKFMGLSEFSVKQTMERIVRAYSHAPEVTTPAFATNLKSEQEKALESFTQQNHPKT